MAIVSRLRLLSLPALLVSLLTLVCSPAAWADQPSAPSSRCANATLKGTCPYSSVGMLDGKPYAEAGHEACDGKGGVEVTYRGTGGSTGTMRTTYSVSPVCIGTAVYPYGQSLVSFLSQTAAALPTRSPAALGIGPPCSQAGRSASILFEASMGVPAGGES